MKRRKRFSLVFLLIMAAALGTVVLVVLSFLKGFKFSVYTNETYGVEIQYPSDWTYEENKNGAVVIFYSPLENQLDFFRDNINIVIQDISSTPMTLESYSQLAVEQMKTLFGQNMQVESLSATTLDRRPARKLIFRGAGPNADLKYLSVWMIDNSKVYQITYLAVASQFNNHLLKILTMLKTFHHL